MTFSTWQVDCSSCLSGDDRLICRSARRWRGRMACYLVTGGAGFIGSHLVDTLMGSGHSIRVLDDLSTGQRRNVAKGAELVVGDVADPGDVTSAMQGVDGCFHL